MVTLVKRIIICQAPLDRISAFSCDAIILRRSPEFVARVEEWGLFRPLIDYPWVYRCLAHRVSKHRVWHFSRVWWLDWMFQLLWVVPMELTG